MKPRDLASVLGAAILVLPPLVFVPGLHEPFRLPKQVVSEWLALALLAALGWRASHSFVRVEAPPGEGGRIARAVLPLAAVVLLSSMASAHPEQAIRAVTSFVIAAGAFYGLARWDTRLRSMLDWLSLPATVLALVMLVQHFTRLGDGPWPELRAADARLGLGSLAGNVGDLTAYLVLPALVAQARLAAAFDAQTWSRRHVWWTALLALWVATMLVAQTLVPIVALAAGTMVLWSTTHPGSRRRTTVLASLALLALSVSLLTPLRSRLAIELHELRAGSPQDVLSGRLDGWRVGAHIGKENPWLGAGPGSYRAEFAKAKLALSERGVGFYQGHGLATHFDHAHNEAVEVFADLGVAGSLAAAWLLWLLIRGAHAVEPAHDRGLALGALAAFLLLVLFWFPLRTALVTWPWVFVGAWLLAHAPPVGSARRAPAPASAPPRARPTAPATRRRVAVWTTLACAAATLVYSYLGLERLRANRVLRVAEDQAEAMAQRGMLDRGLLRRNAAALEMGRRGAPDDERFPLAIGSHYLLLGDLSSAESWYQRALDLAPRAEAYLNLGRVSWLRGDVARAHCRFTKAITLSPLLQHELPPSATLVESAANGSEEEAPCGCDEPTHVDGSVSDATFAGCSVTSNATVKRGTVVFRTESLALRSGFRVRRGAAFRAVSGGNGASQDALQSPRPP